MSETAPHHDGPPATEAETVKDPVCGMTVNPPKTTHRAEQGMFGKFVVR
jgi:hypothetical protein